MSDLAISSQGIPTLKPEVLKKAIKNLYDLYQKAQRSNQGYFALVSEDETIISHDGSVLLRLGSYVGHEDKQIQKAGNMARPTSPIASAIFSLIIYWHDNSADSMRKFNSSSGLGLSEALWKIIRDSRSKGVSDLELRLFVQNLCRASPPGLEKFE